MIVDNNLNLHPVKKAYYNPDSNRYETDIFSSNHNEFNYSLETTSGNKYRILVYGVSMSDVKVELRDDQENILKIGEQANVAYSAKYLVFEAATGINYHIHIEASNPSLFGQNFYLTFEEIGTYFLSWKGKNWLCDGDWEINSNNQLVHIGHNSGFSKWAKIADESYKDCTISLEFDVPNAGLSDFLGIAVNAGDDIFNMINLPSVARQFKIKNLNYWEFQTIDIGNNGGIGRNTGYFSQVLNTGSNQLDCNIQSDSLRYKINGAQVYSAFNDLYGVHKVYITVEDIGTDSLFLNNFTIN